MAYAPTYGSVPTTSASTPADDGVNWGRAVGNIIKTAAVVGAVVFSPQLADVIGAGFEKIGLDGAANFMDVTIGDNLGIAREAIKDFFVNKVWGFITGATAEVQTWFAAADATSNNAVVHLVQEAQGAVPTPDVAQTATDTAKSWWGSITQTVENNPIKATAGAGALVAAGAYAKGRSDGYGKAERRFAQQESSAAIDKILSRGPAGAGEFAERLAAQQAEMADLKTER